MSQYVSMGYREKNLEEFINENEMKNENIVKNDHYRNRYIEKSMYNYSS